MARGSVVEDYSEIIRLDDGILAAREISSQFDDHHVHDGLIPSMERGRSQHQLNVPAGSMFDQPSALTTLA